MVIAKRVVDETNRYRLNAGLRPLVWYEELATIATGHCDALKGGLVTGSAGFQSRVQNFPYKSSNSAENIAKLGSRRYSIRVCGSWEIGTKRVKYDVAKEAVEEWIVSEPHRNVLEGDFNAAGVGAIMADDYTWYIVSIYAKFEPAVVNTRGAFISNQTR